jgi:SH3-like domain-containing protein
MGASVVTVLEQAMPVRTRGTDGGWVRIVTPDNAGGWIHGRLLADERR